MIRIIGSPDAVFGVFHLPRNFTMKDGSTINMRTEVLGPYPWAVPPRNGVWYPAEYFGLNFKDFDIDFFDKDLSRREWHNAYHGKADGVLISQIAQSSSMPPWGSTKRRYYKYKSADSISPSTYGILANGNLEYYRDIENSHSVESDVPLVGRGDWLVYPRNVPGPPSPDWPTKLFSIMYTYYLQTSDDVTFQSNVEFTKLNSLGLHANFGPSFPYLSPVINDFKYLVEIFNSTAVIKFKRIRQSTGGEIDVECDILYRWSVDSSPGTQTTGTEQISVTLRMIKTSLGSNYRGAIEPAPQFNRDLSSLVIRRAVKNRVKQRRFIRTKALVTIDESLEMNNIENIIGIPGLIEVIKTLKDGFVAVKSLNIRAALKFLSNAYLIYSYVVKPGLSDIGKIGKDGRKVLQHLDTLGSSRTRRRATIVVPYSSYLYAKEISVRFSAEFVLVPKTDDLSNLVVALDLLGLLPSASNLWDLVPLSFVIDWFLGIGDVLDAIRLDRDELTFQLLARVESQKYSFVWTDATYVQAFGRGLTPITPVQATVFTRSVYQDWGSIDPLSQAGLSNFSFAKLFQGVALLHQRIAK